MEGLGDFTTMGRDDGGITFLAIYYVGLQVLSQNRS